MYYYAYINSSNICEGTYAFPSQITDASYIYLGTTDDQSVIGKRQNATTQQWEEVTNFYYAQLDERDICIGVVEYPSAVTSDSLIRISSLDETLVGMWYDRTTETFKVAPFRILADHSTDVVNYRDTDQCLSDALDLKANSADVYTKGEADAKFALIGEGGSDGANGLSAYQIACNNGFEGTETEWLASLQGEDGTDGTTVVVGTTTTGDAGTSAAVVGVQDGNTLTLNFTIPKGADGQNGTGADVTANDILDKLKTVDGQNSGLDADLLDGHNADYFATATQLAGKADADHTHTGYAASDHTHSSYAAASHTHSEYASASHTHSNYASTSHTHSNYAVADDVYTKDEADAAFLPLTGGELSGALNVKGIIRCNGNQSIYISGTNCTFGTNNATGVTFACAYSGSAAINAGTFSTYTILPRSYDGAISATIGNSSTRFKYIYLQNSPSVSSDLRAKRDVRNLDVKELAEFVGKLNVVGYNYKEDSADDKEKIGVIAQQLIEANDKVAPYFVDEDEEGMLSLRLSDLVFPLIAAVQDLQKRVAELENK